MRKVTHFFNIKEGDCYLFQPKNTEDKRKTIVIIGNKIHKVFAFDNEGIMKKIDWKHNDLQNLEEFYPDSWTLHKLKRNETKKLKKELIVLSL
jgi:hypothetical protein